MPRIRTIKPEFWQDEKLAALDPLTRLVFLGLVSMADDGGRLVDNVKSIDGFLFPETDDTAGPALESLQRLARIIRYTGPSGQRLIQVANWGRHQKVNHPSSYVLPGPTPEDIAATPVTESSRKTPENNKAVTGGVLASTYDLRPTTNDLLVAGATNGAAVVTGAKRTRAPPGLPAVPNWVPDAVEIHERHLGVIDYGKLGSILKPLVAKRGWTEVRSVWDYFCEFSPVQDYLTRVEAGTVRDGETAVKKLGYHTSPKAFVEGYTYWLEQATK